ncbi:hypothetical protein [Psychrobacter arcticus]|nr:hypothetical protein [Psychrobacter arcticus]
MSFNKYCADDINFAILGMQIPSQIWEIYDEDFIIIITLSKSIA